LRSILVTGSGSGIGAAIVERLAAPRTGILVHAKDNRKGAEKVAAKARKRGAEAIVLLGDLSETGTGAILVEAAVDAFGGLDVLIANAGFPVRGGIGSISRAELDHAFAAIPGGLFDMLSAAYPHLKHGRDPRVIGISTHNAHVFRNDYPVYPCSGAVKAALEVMLRAAAVQFAKDGITVNAVAPGLVRKQAGTPQFLSAEEWAGFAAKVPLGRIGEPEEIAALVAFLASPDAGYITGQVIRIDGGLN